MLLCLHLFIYIYVCGIYNKYIEVVALANLTEHAKENGADEDVCTSDDSDSAAIPEQNVPGIASFEIGTRNLTCNQFGFTNKTCEYDCMYYLRDAAQYYCYNQP